MKLALLDDWHDSLRHLKCFEKLKPFDVTIFNDHCADEDQLIVRLLPFDCVVLFRERTQITAKILAHLPNLKLISQRSVYPHIDVEACTRHQVLLCSNMHQGQPSHAAAELTWALILASFRQIPAQTRALADGAWQCGVGRSLHGRTLGLYGYGRIAKEVAEVANAFGMSVLWWASEEGRQRASADGHPVAQSREAFFKTPDILSLHLRLKPQTQGIITAADFALMRKDALFVNTARAGLLEAGALLNALNAGRPGFAALDVHEIEPITWPNDPLATHPRTLATPHIGFVTEDEFELQFSDIFDQVLAFHEGAPIHMINPEVLQGTSS